MSVAFESGSGPPERESFVRLSYIVGDNGVLPISRSTWYAGIKAGIYPPPRRLGPRISVWSKAEIDRLCRHLSGE